MKQSVIFSSVCSTSYLNNLIVPPPVVQSGRGSTLWRVRMISIKQVYPSRRGVGSSAMRVDETFEYEISRRYDVSRDGDLRWSQGMKKGESLYCVVRKDAARIFSFGVWMSLMTIVAATWGYSSSTPRRVVVGVFFGPRYAMCSRRCPAQ